jgi:hypothetical protein
VAAGRLVAATTTGGEHLLWISDDGGLGWRELAAPVELPAGAEQSVSLLGVAERLLMIIEDGAGGELMVAPVGKP